jgi:hypothetical protein
MKLVHSLMLSAALFLIPVVSSAGLLGDIIGGITGGDDVAPAPVPEPSGALLMGLALVTVAIVGRRIRR